MFASGVSSVYIYIMHYLNFFCHIQSKNLTLASLSRLIIIKNHVNFPVLQVLISTVVFGQSKQLLKIRCTIFLLTVDILTRNIVFTIAHYERLQPP